MKRISRHRLVRRLGWLLLAAVLLPVGCRKATPPSSPAPKDESIDTGRRVGGAFPSVGRLNPSIDLKDLALQYQTQADTGNPPKKLEDLADYQRTNSKVYQAIKEGHYIVLWGSDPARAQAGTTNTVLAYEKDVPTKGGVVVFLDGNVRPVTAQEFQTLAKGK
jgi:hypothetical protein